MSIIMLLSPIYVVDLTSWCGRWCVRKKTRCVIYLIKLKKCSHVCMSILFCLWALMSTECLVISSLMLDPSTGSEFMRNCTSFLSDRFQRQHNYSNIIKFTSLDGSCTMNKRYYAKQYWVLVKFKFFGQNKGETWKDN